MSYAEKTKVPVARSRDQITDLLQAAGASGFGYAQDGEREALYFVIGNRQVRIINSKTDDEREQRRRWRALHLLVKAKLVSVAEGISTIEREFLHDIVLADGTTVGEWLLPQLKKHYETGKMPPLLPGIGETTPR